jgi:hypothetical protein
MAASGPPALLPVGRSRSGSRNARWEERSRLRQPHRNTTPAVYTAGAMKSEQLASRPSTANSAFSNSSSLQSYSSAFAVGVQHETHVSRPRGSVGSRQSIVSWISDDAVPGAHSSRTSTASTSAYADSDSTRQRGTTPGWRARPTSSDGGSVGLSGRPLGGTSCREGRRQQATASRPNSLVPPSSRHKATPGSISGVSGVNHPQTKTAVWGFDWRGGMLDPEGFRPLSSRPVTASEFDGPQSTQRSSRFDPRSSRSGRGSGRVQGLGPPTHEARRQKGRRDRGGRGTTGQPRPPWHDLELDADI